MKLTVKSVHQVRRSAERVALQRAHAEEYKRKLEMSQALVATHETAAETFRDMLFRVRGLLVANPVPADLAQTKEWAEICQILGITIVVEPNVVNEDDYKDLVWDDADDVVKELIGEEGEDAG